MTELDTKQNFQCPACHSSNFSVQDKGLLIKKKICTCTNCKTILETKGKEHFVITTLGDQYSSAKPFFEGQEIKIENLSTQPIISDEWLNKLSNGDDELLQEFFDRSESESADTSIILKKDELIAIRIPKVNFAEERSKRVSSGYSGTSIRVAKGISFRVGSVGESKYEQEIKSLDSGELLFTNKRYFFVGNKKNITQPLSKITIITPYKDAIGISRENKQKTEFFRGSDHITWIIIAALVRGLIIKGTKA